MKATIETPAENMGKALVAGEITADNAAEKTEDMNTTMNTDTHAKDFFDRNSSARTGILDVSTLRFKGGP